MAFDRNTFWLVCKQRFAAASKPSFVPVPDEAIEDEADRTARHEAALRRTASAHHAAAVDAAAQNIAYLAARRTPELWPEGEAAADALLASAQQHIADGSADALADAGLQLLIASFLQSVKE